MKICIIYCNNKSQKKKFIKTMCKLALSTIPLIVTMGVSSQVLAGSVEAGVNTANSVGYEIWKVVKWAAMWVMAALAVKDILQVLNEGDYKQVLQIMFKYGIAFACVAGMIKFFIWIDTLVNR